MLRGVQHNVGDFVWKTEGEEKKLYRILSAFQATKSWMGYWSKRREKVKEELQKRGKNRCSREDGIFDFVPY
jgi:hypothetical protein